MKAVLEVIFGAFLLTFALLVIDVYFAEAVECIQVTITHLSLVLNSVIRSSSPENFLSFFWINLKEMCQTPPIEGFHDCLKFK